MPKVLVTHQSPDLDAIGSVWMFKRFLANEYAEAPVVFVPAGKTISAEQFAELQAEYPDLTEDDITHVDTGLGKFDHHQEERGGVRVCGTSLVFDEICKRQPDKRSNRALREIVEYVTQIDHFEDSRWENASQVRYFFLLHELLDGAKVSGQYNDNRLMEFVFQLLDAAYAKLTVELRADELIQKEGQSLRVGRWNALAIASSNAQVEKRAQKLGFDMVIRKDEANGWVRIKATPSSEIDLTDVYKKILQEDLVGEWFFHNSKRMLFNGSSKGAPVRPSALSLTQVVKIVREALQG